ncbi:MAG: low molecular weight protein-tyrosine-phosphatase [Verrucomicrobiota bacterium]
MKKVLFLCMGNICRSPAAHCVFQQLVDRAGLSHAFEIESAGTIGFHVGEPPDGRMQDAMRKRKIPVIGKSRRLSPNDLADYDLILAMDLSNLRDAQALDPDKRYHDKIRLFCQYCTEHDEAEVPDPYYGGLHGFDNVLDLIEDGCRGLLDALRPDRADSPATSPE